TVNLIGRYDTALTNQMVKLMHEIERLQRIRAGEKVAPPLTADISLELHPPSTADSEDPSPPAQPPQPRRPRTQGTGKA
ncbi:MAG: hypothetical protein HQ592_15665, partial [Planctomycetes bacterium]|nr:hypothetical protein [Planctomycetota bacterium]